LKNPKFTDIWILFSAMFKPSLYGEILTFWPLFKNVPQGM